MVNFDQGRESYEVAKKGVENFMSGEKLNGITLKAENIQGALDTLTTHLKISLDRKDINAEQYQELIIKTVQLHHDMSLAKQGLKLPASMEEVPGFTKLTLSDPKGFQQFSKTMNKAGFDMRQETYLTGRKFHQLNLPSSVILMDGKAPSSIMSALISSKTPGLTPEQDVFYTNIDGNFPKDGSLEGASVTLRSQLGESSTIYFQKNNKLLLVMTAVDESGVVSTQTYEGTY